MLKDISPYLTAELARSIERHPAQEWAELTPYKMIHAILGESYEALVAEAKGDIDGEHGVKRELMHVICVGIRAIVELRRREAILE